MIRIKEHSRHELRTNTVNRLRQLTFKDGGLMEDDLINHGPVKKVFVARNSHKKIVGWTMVLSGFRVYVFVDPKYRNTGIGAKLIEKTRESENFSIKVYPHDHRSVNFYNKLKRIHGRDYLRTY